MHGNGYSCNYYIRTSKFDSANVKIRTRLRAVVCRYSSFEFTNHVFYSQSFVVIVGHTARHHLPLSLSDAVRNARAGVARSKASACSRTFSCCCQWRSPPRRASIGEHGSRTQRRHACLCHPPLPLPPGRTAYRRAAATVTASPAGLRRTARRAV